MSDPKEDIKKLLEEIKKPTASVSPSKDDNLMSSEEMDQLIDSYWNTPELKQYPRSAIALYLKDLYNTLVTIPVTNKSLAGPRMGALKLWGEALKLTRALRSGDTDETGNGRSTPEFRINELIQKASQIPPKPGK